MPLADLAQWNGTTWSNIGGTSSGGDVLAISSVSGSLYVGGSFSSMGGVAINNLARWNGTSWFQAGQPNGQVSTLIAFSALATVSRRLFVGGSFTSVGGLSNTNCVAFSPSAGTWTTLGSPPIPTITPTQLITVSTGPNSYELVGLWFYCSILPGVCPSEAYTLSPSGWLYLGNGSRNALALGLNNGQIAVGAASKGLFSAFQRFNGTTWSPPPAVGAPSELACMVEGQNGEIFASTDVSWPSAWIPRQQVLRRDAATGTWSQVGGEFLGDNTRIFALLREPNGNLVAAGLFSEVGGVPATNIVRWNGTTWSPLGPGLDGTIYALERASNGDLFAAGAFASSGGAPMRGFARWNGSSWSAVGSPVVGTGYALKVLPDGSLIAGGSFAVLGSTTINNIARFDGIGWSPLGGGLGQFSAFDGIYALERLADGTIIAGGSISSIGASVFRQSGSGWMNMSSGLSNGASSLPTVHALQATPAGELLAAGQFLSPSQNVARWNGTSWIAVDTSGLSGGQLGLGSVPVRDLLLLSDGRVAAAGSFINADGQVSAFFARWGAATGCSPCDSLDFNNDGLEQDPTDLEAFFSVYSGGPCLPAGTSCNDIDFNNDGLEQDPTDLESFFSVYSGGPCV